MALLAPLIAGAASAIGFSAAAAGIIGSAGAALAGVGLSVGLNALFAKKKKPGASGPGGVQTSLQAGTEIPRQIVFGRLATRGHLTFWHTSGTNNNRIDLVYVLSDGRCEGLVDVWIGGERKGLTSATKPAGNTEHARYTIDGFGTDAVVRFFDGREGQSADKELIDNTGGRITSDDVGAGQCYVSVTLIYDENKFPNGIPEFTWELDGYRCYDLRKDTTAGGSGSHRWNDPTTWEFTENPAVHAYNYLRGIQAGGQTIMGPEVPAADLLIDYFNAAANACDEDVDLDAGGTEDRYRAAAIISADDTSHREKLAPLIEAMAGYLVEPAGRFGVLAGVGLTSVATITDDDMVLGVEQRFTGRLTRDQRVNAVYGQFVDPAIGYQGNSYPAFTYGAALSEDGEPLRVGHDLEAVTSLTQAQRAARIRLYETRYQASAAITVGAHLIYLDPGDWITWNSAKYGNKTYRVQNRVINDDDTVTLSLRETAAAVYGWATTDEGTAPTAPTFQVDPTLPATVSSLAVTATSVTGDTGQIEPALSVEWTPPEDPRIDEVIFEYRKPATVAVIRVVSTDPEAGEFLISGGLLAGTDYEVRATIRTTPRRATAYTSWVPVTTLDDFALPNGAIDFAALSAQIRAEIDLVTNDALGSLAAARARFDQLAERVATANTEELLLARDGRLRMTRLIAARSNANEALLLQEQQVRADADSALASDLTVLETTVNGNTSSLSVVAASVDGIEVKYGVTGTINGTTGGFVFGGVVQLDGSVSYTVEISGDLLVDGSIIAAKLDVDTLDAVSANVGVLTAGVLRDANSKMIIDLDNASIAVYD